MAVLAVLLIAGGIWVGGGPLAGRDEVWQRIQETGEWRVGLDPSFPPFEMLDGIGRPIGFDVDLAEQIAASWGVTVTFHSIGFDSLFDAVMAGRIDSAISALPVDPRFARDVSYSIPYFDAGLVWLTRSDRLTISHLADWGDKRVAVERGSESDAFLRRLSQRVPDVLVERYPSCGAVVRVVLEGNADVTLLDAITAWQVVAHNPGLQIVGEVVEPLPYVAVLPMNAPRLMREVNRAIIALQTAGELDRLQQKWLTGGEGSAVGQGQACR